MLVYNVITVLCLALMVAGMLSVVINLIIKKRGDKIMYLRSFKRGKSALVYFFAIPLYWINSVYAGDTVFNGFFAAVRRIGELFLLRYDIASVSALAEANPLYKFTMYFCFILVTLNALLFAISLAGQRLWNYFGNLKFRCSRKQKLVIFGNNAQSQLIYRSEKNRAKLIVDKIDDGEMLSLYVKNIIYHSTALTEIFICKLVENAVKRKEGQIVVINTGDDERNIQLCRLFATNMLNLSESERELCFASVKIFVFGNPKYQLIYEEVVSDSLGCVTYVNKYQEIATDCIDKYPFAQFMTEQQIDYQTSLVKPDVDINAFFVGFGKTNQQIFVTSVANNQFVTQGPSGVEVKKVNYHVFDRTPAQNNKNLNHNYNRYKVECANVNADDYLPLPDHPAEEHFYNLDVNDTSFYETIRQIVTQNPNSVNFLYVAFGGDLENVDMAQKLLAKLREWNVENFSLFVRLSQDHQGQKLLDQDNCYAIGEDKTVVYNIENIVGDGIFKMAQMRNAVYDLEYNLTGTTSLQLTEEKILQIKEQAYKNWYIKKSQMERDSSLYCCLSLRAKLLMMGLDYCAVDANDKPALSREEYLNVYAKGDMPNFDYYNATVDGKPIVRYSLNFAPSRRRNLAIHEHLRWNAFMLANGFVPATKQQILQEKRADGRFTNGRNYSVRRHGNLTTFDGLLEFRKLVAQRDNNGGDLAKLEELTDVIKYDYQLLDDAHWLLTKAGYKIVKR